MTYLLRNGKVIKCTMAEYLHSLAEGERFVLRTVVDAIVVQTCFTGLDMTQNELKPEVFETSVVEREAIDLPIHSMAQMAEKATRLQGAYVGAAVCTSTMQEALKAHEDLCQMMQPAS